MGTIPTSAMPGHKLIHNRVCGVLDLCQETQSVELKESEPWESLKWHLIAGAMAMGNLRDGGLIIVGVSERDRTPVLEGISDVHLRTYDPDVILDAINKYSSPTMTTEAVLVPYNGMQFLAFQIPEFETAPYVCRRNGPPQSGLLEGAIYVRPPGKPQTTRVTNAEQMRDLLELAGEKRAREMIGVSYRIGFSPHQTAGQQFDSEVQDLQQ